MKIGVNTLFLIPGEVGGSETYLREALKAMVGLPDCFDIVLFTNIENDAVLRRDLESSRRVVFDQLRFRASNRYSRIMREQFELPFRVKKAGVDVLWSPGYTAPFFCCVPQVVSILDMQYKHHPEDFSVTYLAATHALVSMSARRAKRIIAISEFSKSEVMKYTGQLASKIDVTPLAGDASCGEHLGEERKGAVLRKYGIAGAPYIFCVANTYPHKQVHMLVEAYGRIMDRIPHRLVILGRARLGEGLVENAMAKVSDRDRVSRLDYIDREDLPALYQAASLFVFPSVYEGFGLPVLEAMMAGVRVLTNRSASIPEVGGDTVAYSRPDAESMAASILEALGEDQARRRTRLQQAAERAASLFSWTKCARATLKSFSDALADD